MKNMLKLGIILALFAAAACVMLAFVYSATEAIKVRRQQTDMEAALKELFPGADRFTEITAIKSPDLSVTIESQYKALRGEETAGAALQVSRGSYGGPIKMLVGVSAEGVITGVKILEHKDTPGLGAKAASPRYFVDRAAGITFYGQFAGKSIRDPFEVRDDVQAITASTITSRAVAAAVKAAGTGVMAWLAGESVEVDANPAATDGSDTMSREGAE
ncbi:MAG: FMN-binding protein [Treponema sp.]|jgi:electron transport complex protein RnfG|nr:FMN-binding protein [Treponema sp.]